jgi:hypothetical protein
MADSNRFYRDIPEYQKKKTEVFVNEIRQMGESALAFMSPSFDVERHMDSIIARADELSDTEVQGFPLSKNLKDKIADAALAEAMRIQNTYDAKYKIVEMQSEA